jgi:hypothetical protein
MKKHTLNLKPFVTNVRLKNTQTERASGIRRQRAELKMRASFGPEISMEY